VDWIHLAQDRVQWVILWTQFLSFGFHKMRGIFWLSRATISFSRRNLAVWHSLRLGATLQPRYLLTKITCKLLV
jgi:hypothetical protein